MNTYNLHNILKINSDEEHFIPEYFRTSLTTTPDIIINTMQNNPPVKLNRDFTEVSPGLCYSKTEETVTSTLSLMGIKAFWSLKNIVGTPTQVSVNRTYRLLSKTLLKQPLSTAFPVNAYIQMINQVKLLQKNHNFLVGACFEPNNKNAMVISSMGGMGKTSLIFKIMKEKGNKFLSDDMVIINGSGQIYSYPKPVRIRQVSIPPMHIEKYVSPAFLLGSKDQIKDQSEIGAIILLERGSETELKQLSLKEALNKILLINRKLLPYYMERSLIAYSYMDAFFNISTLKKSEDAIMYNFLKDATCYSLKSRFGDIDSSLKILKGIANGNL